MAGAQAGAKTRGDLKNIDASGGKEGFIEAAGVEGTKKGIVSKAQNIDMLDQKKSQNYVDDINREVIQHQSPAKKSEMIADMKSAGMVTQDSTEKNLVATSGEQFAAAQAKLAAGAMDRVERMAIGGTAITSVRSVSTGKAATIMARSGHSFADGNEVSHNHGINIKNTLQWGANKAGADTTRMGTVDADVEDEVAGGAVTVAKMALAGAAVVGGVAGIDKKFNDGKLSKSVSNAKHKAFGYSMVTDADENTGWFAKDEVEKLKKDGMIKQDANGEWKSNQKGEVLNAYSSSGKPLFTGVNTNAKTTANASVPSINSNGDMDNSLIKDIGNYTTDEKITEAKSNVKAMNPIEAGKKSMLNSLDAAKANLPEGDAGGAKLLRIEQMEEANQMIDQRSTFAGANTNASTTANATASKNVDIKSPLLNSNQHYTTNQPNTPNISGTSPIVDELPKGATPEESLKHINKQRTKLDAIDDKVVGRDTAISALDEVINTQPADSPTVTRATQMKNALTASRPVNVEQFNELTGGTAPSYKDGGMNLDRMGKEAKNQAHILLNIGVRR